MFERLKKLWKESKQIWKEAKQKVEDTDDSVIRMNWRHIDINQNEHETTQVDLSPIPCSPPSFGDERPTPIDIEIAELVAEMNRVGIKTTCSCQGHDDDEAYVSIRLGEGTTYLHRKDIFGPGQDELTLNWRRK